MQFTRTRAAPTVYLQVARVEDQFVFRKLHPGAGLDRDRGPVRVDFRSAFLPRFDHVVGKNRGGIGRRFPIQPGAAIAVEHRPPEILPW